jgi:hypothetical protein
VDGRHPLRNRQCGRFTVQPALDLAADAAARYEISALTGLLASDRALGVVPVTAAVTEIRYGSREEKRVHDRDGRDDEVPLNVVASVMLEYVAVSPGSMLARR